MELLKSNKPRTAFLVSLLLLLGGTPLASLTAQELAEEDVEIVLISCGIGARPEGTRSRSNDMNVTHKDMTQQVGDNLILLRKDTLYSIALNSDSDEPAEIISQLKIDRHTDELYYEGILVSDDFVIVLSYRERGNQLSFYSLGGSAQLAFEKSYFTDDIDGFLNTMTVVDNRLVSIVDAGLDEDLSLSDLEAVQNEVILGFSEQPIGESESDEEQVMLDMVAGLQWSNSLSSLAVSGGATAILNCPLDDLLENGLSCDTSLLLGAYNDSYYVSPNAVYVAGSYFTDSNVGVVAQDTDAFFQRSDHVVNADFIEEKSAIYRLDLIYNEVTAVLYEGPLLSRFSYQELGDSFVALLKKPGVLGDIDESVYGLHFSLDQFSDLPILLPLSDYQFLTLADERVSANRFSSDRVVLAKGSGRDSSNKSQELVLWDIESDGVYSFESDYYTDSLYFQNDYLIAIGSDNESNLVLETWSLGEEIERKFSQVYPYHAAVSNIALDYGHRVWGMPIYRLDEDGDAIDYIANTQSDSQDVIDMAYFQLDDDGSVSEKGQLIAKPYKADDECEVSCEGWYGLEQALLLGDSVYALTGDQIIKSVNSHDGLQEQGYLNLLPAVKEESKEDIDE